MQTLLNLLAGVSLLIWGTHIVRTGVLRLYGGDLRRVLRHSVSNRVAAFFAGVGVTGLIQSSTATALIVAAFAGQGIIDTAPALAVMLGADVGTSLVTVRPFARPLVARAAPDLRRRRAVPVAAGVAGRTLRANPDRTRAHRLRAAMDHGRGPPRRAGGRRPGDPDVA